MLRPIRRLGQSYLRRETPDLQLVDQDRAHVKSKAHFMAIAATAMRRLLIDSARRKNAGKRGGDFERITIQTRHALVEEDSIDLMDLEQAIEKLKAENERLERLVVLRFYGGLSMEEISDVLDVSVSTLEKNWTYVKAWLRREFEKDD